MAKTTVHQELKKLREQFLISRDGHGRRIKEQRKIIADAKKAIKMHKLLIKQSHTEFKLKQLEVVK